MDSTQIQTYLEKIRSKDPLTCEHCGKSAEYALRLGQMLNLATDELDQLKEAAMLHDIGKIMVPNEILMKPAALTEEEYAVIKRHPAWGAEIIEEEADSIPWGKMIAQIVRYHHERYDGSGYPEGLPGEKIPLLSRIVAIADAFDAMTSDRPYRSGMTRHEARDILVEERGRQFEPGLVDMFVEAVFV